LSQEILALIQSALAFAQEIQGCLQAPLVFYDQALVFVQQQESLL
jgi:hypothetical protein